MSRKPKLELTWVGKDERPRLEPRILLEQSELSYHAKHRVSEADRFDNLLIHGDNLLALKALEQEFRGQVKCIFIDPPYNTGSAFTHYDDGLEHSLWLSMMRDRLELLRELLSKDGSIWITIDDNEAHYLKVLCDEVFGRRNFISNVVWQKTLTRRNDARAISTAHDHVLVYAKCFEEHVINKLDASGKQRATYQNRDDDPRGDWLAVPFHAPNIRPNLTYEIVTPGGRSLWPPKGRCWSTTREKYEELVADNRIYFGKDGNGMAQRKKFWNESENKIVPWTWWGYEEAGDNREANREAKAISELGGVTSVFDTPKPEKLLNLALEIATNPGDLVLDSFAGSGTTGAVAHKMGRRWIMVELGEHCHTHIVPRLRKVIDGEDPGGVTASTDWKGGGGFRYCRLAPSLLREDAFGNLIINPEYRPEMLAEAVCKLMGYTYAPSEQHYWQHGQASERDFLYVTTASLTHEQLRALSEDVGPERTLLVCCKAFRAKAEAFENLTLQKIPQTVLDRCEWDRDDYSLRIANLPLAPDAEDTAQASATQPARGRKRSTESPTSDLFGGDEA
ncbi:MAG: site-specific DNA-methyltransferase [Lysobacteraceae bacterium]